MVCPKCGLSEATMSVSLHEYVIIYCVCGNVYKKYRKERWERSMNDDDWMDHYILDDPDLKDYKLDKNTIDIINESKKASES